MTPSPISLADLAAHIEAELVNSAGTTLVKGLTTLDSATAEQISFFSNRAYRERLAKTCAAAVILAPTDKKHCPVPMLVMDNPYLGYAKAAYLFKKSYPAASGIHPSAWVSPDAILAEGVSIAAQAVVEAGVYIAENVVVGAGCVIQQDVEIGANSCLIANVTLCAGVKLGQRVILHPGVVIGADGFGLAHDRGAWMKIPQLGSVSIGNDVEIGANTTVDRGALTDTVLEDGVKLDNQIQVAHNVYIGAHTVIAGCAGIAGSTHVGKHCMIGGGVNIGGHLQIADNVQVTGRSVIMQSITEPGVYSSGTPLEPNAKWHRNYARMKQLDALFKRVSHLEKYK